MVFHDSLSDGLGENILASMSFNKSIKLAHSVVVENTDLDDSLNSNDSLGSD